MFKDWTYQEATEKAEAIKVIGLDEIYLNEGEFPWHLVTKVEPGSSHRLEISTSVWFYAHDPVTDLNFRWSFDIEGREANGRGIYMIKVRECLTILELLPPKAEKQFQEYLTDCAEKITKHADELDKYAKDEYKTAKRLEEASK